MREFIEKYPEIFPLFEKHGFRKPIVYKNPEEPDTDEVIILVESIFSAENEPKGRAVRKLNLKDELRRYITCKFLLLTDDYVNDSEIRALNVTNSMSLTPDLSSEELEGNLVKIFGKEWVFGKSPLASSQEAKTPFWGKESTASVSDDDVLQLVNKEASKALKENAAASLAEKLSCVAERLTQCASRLSADSPKVK